MRARGIAYSVPTVLVDHARSTGFTSQHHIKQHMVTYTCNLALKKAEAGGSEIQGCPWSYREFKVSLGYIVNTHT